MLLATVAVAALAAGTIALRVTENTPYCTAEPTYNGTYYYCPYTDCTDLCTTILTSFNMTTTTNPNAICFTLMVGEQCDNEICSMIAIPEN